jgi:hypothetical protein
MIDTLVFLTFIGWNVPTFVICGLAIFAGCSVAVAWFALNVAFHLLKVILGK